MRLRYEDERYVRIYVRDTGDWLALGWEAQALWLMVERHLDRAGILELGRTGVRGLAALVGMPVELVERALPRLLEGEWFLVTGTTLLDPEFIDANEAAHSDRQRKSESRARARDRAANGARGPAPDPVTPGHDSSRNVTECHETGRSVTEEAAPVTPGHTESPITVPCRAVPCSTDLSERASVSSYTLPPVTPGHNRSRNVTEEAADDEQHSPAEKPAPALEPGAGTTAASPPAATPAPALVHRPKPPEDERPARRCGLVLDLTEIPDEAAATAKAELEALLRKGYGAKYEKALLLGGTPAAEEATRGEWIERVHTLGAEAVVVNCLEQAGEYWRRTAGHVESLRFFLAGLARLRAPRPAAEGAARA